MKKPLLVLVLLLIGVGAHSCAVLPFLPGLACAAALLILSRRGFWSAGQLALGSMAVKLAQIPAYVAGFSLGAVIFLFAGFAAASAVGFVEAALAFVAAMAILLLPSGLVGLAAVLRCRMEGRLTTKAAVVNGILQFVFCADVVSAIWVFIKSRKGNVS